MTVADERRERAQRNYEKHLAERLSAAKAVASRAGPNSIPYLNLDKEYEKANGIFEATQAELNDRPPHIRFENPWMFWIPAFIVFAMEAFINKIIVDMAAQTPGGISLLISGLLSVLLVWLAHNAGVSWRQVYSDLERRIVWSSLIWGVALVVVILLFVVGLMTLRAYFALVDTASDMNLFDTVKGVSSLGVQFVTQAFTVPESLTIGGLNFLALMFAFLFAFLSHDSDKEYDRRYIEMKRAKRARAKAQKRYEAEQEKIHGRFKRPIARTLRAFVGNGGDLRSLEADDFKAQRFEAEREIPLEHAAERDGNSKADGGRPRVVPMPAASESKRPSATSGNPW